MEYTYQYFIHGIDVHPTFKGYENVVCRITYCITGTAIDSENEKYYSITSQPTSDIIQYEQIDTFISYENLTKEMVVNWLEINVPDKLLNMKRDLRVELHKYIYSDTIYFDKPFGNQ